MSVPVVRKVAVSFPAPNTCTIACNPHNVETRSNICFISSAIVISLTYPVDARWRSLIGRSVMGSASPVGGRRCAWVVVHWLRQV